MSIPLRVAGPTGRYRRDLRRFTFKGRGPACPATDWGHDATTTIGEIGEAEHEQVHGGNWPHDDPRWPAACTACGYLFTPADEWQRNDNQIYRLPDGTEFTLWAGDQAKPPPGAMIRIPHYDEHSRHPDGTESWLVILPDGGQWITSQRASDGGYWTVTGTPPDITASPSIFHNAPTGWHGWVRDGELVGA